MPVPIYPTIPTPLVAAAAAGRIVPFVGSGISRNCGSPDWAGFANGAVEQALRLDLISDVERAVLLRLAPRTALSIVSQREDSRKIWLDYAAILHPNGMNYTADGRRIFSALGRMASTFVTTNYDRWLDQAVAEARDDGRKMPEIVRTIIYERETFSPEQLLQRNTVIQLHGRCTSKPSMVISTPHYVHHYRADRLERDEENRVLTLLRTLFRDKCVLFTGYGLGEMEILEYVVQKGLPRVTAGEPPRHFALFGFADSQAVDADLMAEYFAGFGVGLLPFSRESGNSHIANVLERLADTLPTREPIEAEIEHELEQLGEDF